MATRGPDPKVSDRQLLTAIVETDHPFAVAKDIADRVGLSRERARQRLNRLSKQDEIERAKVSGVVIYWVESDVSDLAR
jgi:predicted ArsR family transcriptional regulator